MKRRDLLKTAAITTGLGLLNTKLNEAQGSPYSVSVKKRAIRFAHITDVHVRPEYSGDKGFAYLLQHVQDHKDGPEFIINTGDSVFDVLYHPKERLDLEWGLWEKITKENCSIPIESCIGNHDVFGWDKKRAKTTGDEPLYGKKAPMHYFGLKTRYRSFDKAGWHFIALDGIHSNEPRFSSRLDDEQFEWLVKDLAGTNPDTPVLVFSHPPILSVCSQILPDKVGLDPHWTLNDARRVTKLFRKYPNVKLCLGGHNHMLDHVLFDNVTYISGGALSSRKWTSMELNGCPAGYGMVDLYKDGSFNYQYITHDWKARAKDS